MASGPTILDFVMAPEFLGLQISPAQRTLLKAIYGLPLDTEELALWRLCTGRESYRAGRGFPEATVVAGARAGKDSRIAAPVVCYEAVFGGHEQYLARGERGVVPLVAQDSRASRIAFGYVKDYFTRSAWLSRLVAEPPLASSLILANGITIECFPCTLRSLRGWSIPVGVMDELGFFRLEGQADSDVEIQASIRRGMVNFPATRTKLVKISTPYMKSGVLYDDFRRGYGQDNPDLLVWKASSALMNPSLMAERLELERRLDPTRYAREYEAEFAEDLEAFLPGAWVDQAIVPGRYELPPRDGIKYLAAVDPSGGAADAFTLAICHAEGFAISRRIVQDVMKGWSRYGSEALNLEDTVRTIGALCRQYHCYTVHGDRYAAGWVRERFKAEGIRYEEIAVRNPADPHNPDAMLYLDKSMAYLECEPLFAQRVLELLDHPLLIRELKLLERRPRAGGRTLVDHPDGSHDDHANALALATAKASQARPSPAAFAPPQILPGITQLGEPARTGTGVGPRAGGQRPAGGQAGGQAAWVRKKYR